MALRLLVTLSLVVVALGASSFACRVHPDFWCDSLETATTCGVVEQCASFRESSAKRVNVTLFYESMCPFCSKFIDTQMTPAFHKIGSILNFTLVPYGNAKTHPDATAPGGYTFECQHGPEECVGNMIETCAIHFYPDVSAHFPFISCVESSNYLPRVAAPTCASDHGIDYSKIKNCIYPKNPLGVTLENEMGLKTPSHPGVPWIYVNGDNSRKTQGLAFQDLIALACKLYTGTPKPKACTTSMATYRLSENDW